MLHLAILHLFLTGLDQDYKNTDKRSDKDAEKDDDDLGEFVLKVAKELESDKPGLNCQMAYFYIQM